MKNLSTYLREIRRNYLVRKRKAIYERILTLRSSSEDHSEKMSSLYVKTGVLSKKLTELNPHYVNIADCEDLEIDGADSSDYPDFCDAFFGSGTIKGKELTGDQLEYLTDNHADVIGELAYESFL